MKRLAGNDKTTRAGVKLSLVMVCFFSIFFVNPVFAEGNSLATDLSAGHAADSVSVSAQSQTSAVQEAPLQAPGVKSGPVAQQPVKVSSSSNLASVALGLVLIVGLILALGWFMRRFNQGGLFNNSAIKIVATLPMGTRERLAVVDVGGQQLLLGITATQINTLHVFTEPVIEAQHDSPASSEFGRKLRSILQQKNGQ